ncbi:MAG: hypothetical protein AB8B63_02795 [Granulosicoccus sp.]
MANIVILGAGVMGSALAIPPASIDGNAVTLAGSPLDDDIIASIKSNRHHPTLDVLIPNSVNAVHLYDLRKETLQTADIIVIGVSNAGVDWATDYLSERQATPNTLALVTKGLVQSHVAGTPPLTYADTLVSALNLNDDQIVGIGGPCIARELALGYPTRVTFACRSPARAQHMRQQFQTTCYRITTHTNVVALEACAALKNFLCIGVSAMLTAYPLDNGHAKNPLAAVYNQAVRELFILSQWISEASLTPTTDTDASLNHVAFDLAGMGDLHVTVGGGRNSRLGAYLGKGETLGSVLASSMAGVTVEGVDTGRRLLSGFRAGCANGQLDVTVLPLTDAILNCIEHDKPFAFGFDALPS